MTQNRWTHGLTGVAVVLIAVASISAGASSLAHAGGEMSRYHSMHPVSPHVGEFCYIDVPHVHRVSPPDMRVYVRLKNSEFFFVGDQVALGYEGPKFGYFGPHLVADPALAGAERIFCYLTGAHYHSYPSPAEPPFVSKDGVIWYVGEPPPVNAERSWVNEVNPAARGYAAPKVDLSMAPPAYKPMVIAPPPPVAAPTVAPKPIPGKTPANTPVKVPSRSAPVPAVKPVAPPPSASGATP